MLQTVNIVSHNPAQSCSDNIVKGMVCTVHISTDLWQRATQWHYWQDNRLVIHRLQLRALTGHHCIAVLGKLLTPVYTKQYNLVPAKGVISLAGKLSTALVENKRRLAPVYDSPAGWLPRNWFSAVPNARNQVWDYLWLWQHRTWYLYLA